MDKRARSCAESYHIGSQPSQGQLTFICPWCFFTLLLPATQQVCSQNVVHQFARIAQATDFTYCFSILEANKRAPYPVFAGAVAGHAGPEELHTFFPFDPYKLPRSGEYIQGVYREWTAVAIGDDEDEDEDEDDLIEEGPLVDGWEHGR